MHSPIGLPFGLTEGVRYSLSTPFVCNIFGSVYNTRKVISLHSLRKLHTVRVFDMYCGTVSVCRSASAGARPFRHALSNRVSEREKVLKRSALSIIIAIWKCPKCWEGSRLLYSSSRREECGRSDESEPQFTRRLALFAGAVAGSSCCGSAWAETDSKQRNLPIAELRQIIQTDFEEVGFPATAVSQIIRTCVKCWLS